MKGRVKVNSLNVGVNIRVKLLLREVALVGGGQLGVVCVLRRLDESLLDVNLRAGAGALAAQLRGGDVKLDLVPDPSNDSRLQRTRGWTEVIVTRLAIGAAVIVVGHKDNINGASDVRLQMDLIFAPLWIRHRDVVRRLGGEGDTLLVSKR